LEAEVAHGVRYSGIAEIRTFRPDDTEDTIYINGDNYWDLSEIRGKILEKWPGIEESEISLSAEHVHTDCIGYDKYDPSDYTNYIVIIASKSYFARIKAKKT
jgi:hypothetical protein